jgi:hypothetical protein
MSSAHAASSPRLKLDIFRCVLTVRLIFRGSRQQGRLFPALVWSVIATTVSNNPSHLPVLDFTRFCRQTQRTK